MASRAWPFSLRSRPLANVAIIPNWSASRTNFSYPIASPPSSQPAAWSTKLVPAITVGSSVAALSYAAWASGSFDAVSEPPERNGTPRRRASAATVYSTSAGSGVPNVGAPVCIDIELANEPKTTGAPGPHELDERHAGERLGQRLGDDAGRRRRRHRPGEDERRDDRRLVGRGVDLGRGEHRARPTPAATRR